MSYSDSEDDFPGFPDAGEDEVAWVLKQRSGNKSKVDYVNIIYVPDGSESEDEHLDDGEGDELDRIYDAVLFPMPSTIEIEDFDAGAEEVDTDIDSAKLNGTAGLETAEKLNAKMDGNANAQETRKTNAETTGKTDMEITGRTFAQATKKTKNTKRKTGSVAGALAKKRKRTARKPTDSEEKPRNRSSRGQDQTDYPKWVDYGQQSLVPQKCGSLFSPPPRPLTPYQ